MLALMITISAAKSSFGRAGTRLQGRTPRPGDIKVRSNDYLCLAGHPHVIESEIAALRAGGHGDAVSRVWVHHERDITREFEQRVAASMEAEDCVVCASGYTANVGLIQSFATRGAPVYLDMKAHISLHEGVVSAGATPVPFRHNDPQSLDRMLAKHGPGLVAVDALYSTDGDMAPLAELVEVCERHGAALIVDETHSFGAQGPNGAGLVVAAGLAERVHFRTVGLSKAVASRGGLVVSSRRNIEYFRYEALPTIFSTSVMQHEVAGFDAVLDIFETGGLAARQAARQSRLPKAGPRRSRLQRLGVEGADHRARAGRHPPGDDAARRAGKTRRVRRDLLPAGNARQALHHPLHRELRAQPPRARPHHRGVRRDPRRGGNGRMAVHEAQGGSRPRAAQLAKKAAKPGSR